MKPVKNVSIVAVAICFWIGIAHAQPTQPPKPGSSPSFDTPFGFFVSATPFDRTKIVTYRFAKEPSVGEPITLGSADAPVTTHTLGLDQRFLLVRFWNEKDSRDTYTENEVEIAAGDKVYRPILSTRKLDLDLFKAAATSENKYEEKGGVGVLTRTRSIGTAGDSYWVFQMPSAVVECDFCFRGKKLPIVIAGSDSTSPPKTSTSEQSFEGLRMKSLGENSFVIAEGFPYNKDFALVSHMSFNVGRSGNIDKLAFSGFLVAESLDTSGKFTAYPANSAVNITWNFTEPDTSFRAGEFVYTSLMKGASVEFTKEGVVLRGFKITPLKDYATPK